MSDRSTNGLWFIFYYLGFSNNKNGNNLNSSSLYDKLQENKAAKQAEFYEESKEGSSIIKFK